MFDGLENMVDKKRKLQSQYTFDYESLLSNSYNY